LAQQGANDVRRRNVLYCSESGRRGRRPSGRYASFGIFGIYLDITGCFPTIHALLTTIGNRPFMSSGVGETQRSSGAGSRDMLLVGIATAMRLDEEL
jgi:hypothetical protein